MLQVRSDYSKQLNKIVEILNRKQTPHYLVILLPVIVGWLLGIASTPIADWLRFRGERKRIRQMVYREMASNSFWISILRTTLMKPPEERLISENAKDVLQFKAFEYAESKRDVFEALKEVVGIREVYDQFGRAANWGPEQPQLVFKLNTVLDAFESRVGKEFDSGILLHTASSNAVKSYLELLQKANRR